ncbi:unnamed protein product [Moneuplotes crassus]|uniref:CG-1 domain-containing protein n=2 Tax=Euplotes crassus TaxID=5936 RepID=A0AAD1XEY0_EUPCR|nr:unnamed protein product [Moneuplotes crassus]
MESSDDLRTKFLSIVKTRWLKTYEIYSILTNPEFLVNLGIPYQTCPQTSPKSGTFILWNKVVGKNRWKKDGHDWKKRNNTNYVREDQTDLKVNKQDLIGLALFSKHSTTKISHASSSNSSQSEGKNLAADSGTHASEKLKIKCSYTTGLAGSEKTPQTMKRRAYWILGDQKVIIIHYLDEGIVHENSSIKSEIGPPKLDLSYKCEGLDFNPVEQQIVKEDVMNSEDCEFKSLFSDIEIDPGQFTRNKIEMDPCFPDKKEDEEVTQKDKEETKRERSNSFLQYSSIHHSEEMNQKTQNEEIKELYEKIEHLEKKVNTNINSGSTNLTNHNADAFMFSNNLNDCEMSFDGRRIKERDPFSVESIISKKIKILDFSPEWDYVSGGAKLLVCFKPDLKDLIDPLTGIDVYDEIESRFSISFGESEVPIKFIQSGVFKCHAPANPPGYVNLKLFYDGKEVCVSAKKDSNLFQYRENQNSRRKAYVRVKENPGSYIDSQTREFKVRLIETLTGLERDLSQNNGRENSEVENKEAQNINFDQLKYLDDNILEKINKIYFIRVIKLILAKMKQVFGEQRSKERLDRRDSQGMALIHYIVCLDYHEVISDLYKMGANLNIPTDFSSSGKQNMIPITICSHKGYNKCLIELMKYVSVPYPEKEKEIRLDSNNPGKNVNNDDKSDSSFDQEEEEKESICPLECAIKHKNPEILETLLRNMTLSKALRTDESSDADDMDIKQSYSRKNIGNIQGESSQVQAKGRIKKLLTTRSNKTEEAPHPVGYGKELNSLDEDDKFSEESVDEYFVKNSEGYKIEIITDEMRANNEEKDRRNGEINSPNLKNKYLETNLNSKFNEKGKIKKCSSSNSKQIDSLVEEGDIMNKFKKINKRKKRLQNLKYCINDFKKLCKLQKIVKKWILKRQEKDINYASDMIHKELNQKLLKKNSKNNFNQENAIILIQRSVRNWLADKYTETHC